MADSDVDGHHITTLLLTFFYRYFPELIKNGYVYIAQSPLYKIRKGKEIRYAYSDQEKENILKELTKIKKSSKNIDGFKVTKIGKNESEEDKSKKEINLSNIDIQRYKGLGEMNPEELYETTMDCQKRILKKVFIEDAMVADETFEVLMGREVEPRKKFIEAHAQAVQNLDV